MLRTGGGSVTDEKVAVEMTFHYHESNTASVIKYNIIFDGERQNILSVRT